MSKYGRDLGNKHTMKLKL
ncbi:hypothetical protein EYZ11_007674 [Aspergillus tanneri]|uniref:Uncharacterized protein n=1 Tax=Aspergillus tanneri TaxID=1220188 RepID=A0A4S3JI25_9EURO|nr:hypothetical protein EYZ11_007674 [Aspergillus tanneri]